MSEDRKVDICGGVDTHRDVHVAAVVDTAGRVLGSAPFTADTAGYEQLGDWATGYSPTAAWSGLGWKAPAATAPAWPVT